MSHESNVRNRKNVGIVFQLKYFFYAPYPFFGFIKRARFSIEQTEPPKIDLLY